MKLIGLVLLSSALLLSAQTPNLSGVWKADLQKSKFGGGPPITAYTVLIDQQGSIIKETSSSVNPRDEYRASAEYDASGAETLNFSHGLPMKTKATWAGNTLEVEGHIAGTRPSTEHRKYTLSADGKSLEIENSIESNGRTNQQSLVLDKAPDDAADALRKPEETAAAKFKNVKLLGDLPASRFLDTMRFFSESLGTNCMHCHVQGQFDSDEKKEKVFARTMISMNREINTGTFHGKQEVRCYTCHRGSLKPVAFPQ